MTTLHRPVVKEITVPKWFRQKLPVSDQMRCKFSHITHRGHDVTAKASYRGYAAAWLKEHPYNYSRMRATQSQHQAKALKQAEISVCSILRDWIKGQVMAIETGVLTFEGAFLGQIMLPSGRTVLEHATAEKLLPALEGPKS